MGGFGFLHIAHSSLANSSAVDGLRSNPPTDNEKGVSRLRRAISAPPLQLTSHHPHHKVPIRPSDLVITDAAGHHRLCRESVVSTPYPTCTGSVATQEDSLAAAIATSSATQPLPFEKHRQSDRFPSPFHGEILFLQLALVRHPGATTLVEVEIKDKGTFDDAALFAAFRHSYNHNLLNLARRLPTARSLSHATLSSNATTTFDSTDFLNHLLAPKLGTKRKVWLKWLRSQQPRTQQRQEQEQKAARTQYRSSYSASRSRMSFTPTESQPQTRPCITLHYSFAVARILLVVVSTILLSVLATVLWVLFGVPGAQMGTGARIGIDSFDWRMDAPQRVLTGFVLGVLVLLLGSMGSAVWVAGSWTLL
jgi:hypothetical protein